MRLLLHICCAPCVIHPFRELARDSGNSITGFFYNPNIHPYTEMEKRREAVADYATRENFKVIFGEYDMENFFKKISNNLERPSRCNICWRMRLEKTAQYAKKEGFDVFTTTLLVSPYQHHQNLIEIGSEASKEFGVEFLVRDFRDGFRTAQQHAGEHAIYRQKYCGCVFSERESGSTGSPSIEPSRAQSREFNKKKQRGK